jgi:hypothetical protein
MLKYYLFSIFLFSSICSAQIISFNKFSIGKSRIEVDLSDFIIHTKNADIRATWVPNSVQWIRNENNLMIPRALLKIFIKNNIDVVHLNYNNQTVFPAKKKGYVTSEIYLNLFNPENISVYSGKEILDTISVEAKAVTSARSKQFIDYSCSPYNLQINGLDSEYLSVGCKMNRLGKFGKETPRLDVTISSTNLRTLNGEKPPYSVYLDDSSPVEINLLGADHKINTFHLEATLPKRLNRFKTALGIGPYLFQSEYQTSPPLKSLAPSFMIYGKFDINETSSFKMFDALVYAKTFFNNSGMYFSYDLADALDGRVLMNTLLGFQGIHYKYSINTPTVFRLIYPQGFEVVYRHAFIENYNLTYGMFLSTSAEIYTNAWLRYGKSSFLELNYIEWAHEQSHIRMWGLSVGIPFFGAF